MMLLWIFALIGIITVAVEAIKLVSMATLRAEHKDDRVRYVILDKDMNELWKSAFVDEFSSEEVEIFKDFCKEWAKYPGSFATWDRVSK